jgi:hypothetical protein
MTRNLPPDAHRVFASAGRKGAEKRWANHVPFSISLRGLSMEDRRTVLELVRILRRESEA